jgi:hypothetical protein
MLAGTPETRVERVLYPQQPDGDGYAAHACALACRQVRQCEGRFMHNVISTHQY